MKDITTKDRALNGIVNDTAGNAVERIAETFLDDKQIAFMVALNSRLERNPTIGTSYTANHYQAKAHSDEMKKNLGNDWKEKLQNEGIMVSEINSGRYDIALDKKDLNEIVGRIKRYTTQSHINDAIQEMIDDGNKFNNFNGIPGRK